MENTSSRQIRAKYDDKTIRVYQAYSHRIADPAVNAGRFVSPFKMERMTWIKPSFLWMMYRAGWASKEGQNRILAIDITRDGFEWALLNSCLSHYEPGTYESYEQWQEIKSLSPVRIQWDPERDYHLNKLDYRSIQIGLSGEAVSRYVKDWTVNITDITTDVIELKRLIDSKDARDEIVKLLPKEVPFQLTQRIEETIGILS